MSLKFSSEEIQEINNFRRTQIINRALAHSIRQKALYQYISGDDHFAPYHSQLSEDNQIKGDPEWNKGKNFCPGKPFWTFRELSAILYEAEMKGEYAPGVFKKLEFALFCPERRFLTFIIRYDLYKNPADYLIKAVIL